ncbi:MAG: hybrid sensor histidine kinase/response regulator [Chitinivibrionales bacterium]
MKHHPPLSPEILSQMVLMQSVVAGLTDKKAILEFSCRGLKDIDGVVRVDYRIFPEEETRVYSDEWILKPFSIQRNGHTYADLLFHIDDSESFQPYTPHVSNFCSMVAVVLEEHHQRDLAQSLMQDLEKRVIQRTLALESEILERKRAQQALAAEKEQLAITLRSIGDGVITTDRQGRICIINNVAEEMTGWTQQEAFGKPLTDVFNIINEITGKKCENPAEKVLKTGRIVELANHTMLISRDKRKFVIADSGAPITDNGGNTIGVVLVFRDTTEKQKLLEATQRASKLESLGILAGGIAHDFNNLLGGIFGYIDMADELSKQPLVSNYLRKATDSIDRARALTQQLLTFAKGGSPNTAVHILFPFIRDSVQFALSGSNVRCRFDIQKELWPCEIDTNQIGQVIDNIVINAKQAMSEGGTMELSAANIHIQPASALQLTEGPYVKICIRDHGNGIPADIMPKIFDPFFSTKSKGHGLGLSTCYSIIHRHGGTIDVDSESGKGTTFTIYLPASPGANPITANQFRKNHQGHGTLLIMEDEKNLREMIRVMLEYLGYQTVLTGNGREAIETFKECRKNCRSIDGMIFDLTIPGEMGGREALELIRRIDPEIPVFVASGYANDPVMASPQQYGFTASICKPFRKNELAAMLDKHMGSRAGENSY